MAQDPEVKSLQRIQDDIRRKLRRLSTWVGDLSAAPDGILQTYYIPVTPRNSSFFVNGGIGQIALGASVTPGSPVSTPFALFESHLLIVVNTLGVAGTVQITGTSYSFADDTTNPFAQEDILIDTTTTDASTTSPVGIFEANFTNAYMTKLSWGSTVTLTSDGTLNMASINLYQVIILGSASPGFALEATSVTGQSNDANAALDLVTGAYDFLDSGKGNVASQSLSVLAGTTPATDIFGRGKHWNVTYPNIEQGGYGGMYSMLGVTPINKDAFFNVTVNVITTVPIGATRRQSVS